MAAESNSWKLIVAAGASAAVTAGVMFFARPEPPPPTPAPAEAPAAEPAKPAEAPAAEAPAAEAPAAEAPAAELPTAASPAGELPVAPEVGEAAPKEVPALRIPETQEQIRTYLQEASRAVGDAKLQGNLRSARWIFDVQRGPLAGRITLDLDDRKAVLRHPGQDLVLVQSGDRCRISRRGLSAPCEHHEQQLLASIRHARNAVLPEVWLAGARAPLAAKLVGTENRLVITAAGTGAQPGPDGCDAKGTHDVLRFAGAQGRVTSLVRACGPCRALVFEAHATIADLQLPRLWRAEIAARRTAAPDAEPAQPAADDPSDGGGQVCPWLEVALISVSPVKIELPELRAAIADAAPRIESRQAMRLGVAEVSTPSAFAEALGKIVETADDLDRSGMLGGFIVGAPLRFAMPLRAGAGKTIVEIAAGRVARQRVSVSPGGLTAAMAAMVAEVGKSHRVGSGAQLAWPLEIDDGFLFADERARMFELEVPIAD